MEKNGIRKGYNMADIMRGSDIPFVLKNLPVGATIKRLDFAQNDEIIVTKFADDFVQDGDNYIALITQAEALRFNDKRVIEIQFCYMLNGHAKRTRIAKATPDKILYEGEI